MCAVHSVHVCEFLLLSVWIICAWLKLARCDAGQRYMHFVLVLFLSNYNGLHVINYCRKEKLETVAHRYGKTSDKVLRKYVVIFRCSAINLMHLQKTNPNKYRDRE